MPSFLPATMRLAVCLPCFLLVLGLSGCAVQAPVEETARGENFELRQRRLADLNSWQIRGRISVQMDGQAWSASLHWQQREQEYFLRVIAPLGRGTYEIHGQRDGVSMTTADNRLLLADTPEILMQDNFGWHVPVSGLTYWIRGLPAPAPAPDTLLVDAEGRITDLLQSGWEVNYTRFTSRAGYQLPRNIVMHNETLKLRLVILSWELP